MSRNMSQDEAVISTNDDATACKRFAVQQGYWKDDYIQYFAKPSERKAPEISRGYYARTKGMHHLLDQFLALTECNCQVINLGAGFDTLFWKLKEEGRCPKLFVDFDFAAVTQRKCYSIRTRKKLQEPFAQDEGLKVASKEANSRHYHLLCGDLRDVGSLDAKLAEVGVDSSLPTLFLAECVLIYMDPKHSTALIDWAGGKFKTALFLNYEQINLQDRFGQVMIENLRGRNCELLGASACPDVESQTQRFLTHGWQGAETFDMMHIYNCLPSQDRRRVEQLEFLDEVDLLHQLLTHYCISWAYNDDKGLGLGTIGFG